MHLSKVPMTALRIRTGGAWSTVIFESAESGTEWFMHTPKKTLTFWLGETLVKRYRSHPAVDVTVQGVVGFSGQVLILLTDDKGRATTHTPLTTFLFYNLRQSDAPLPFGLLRKDLASKKRRGRLSGRPQNEFFAKKQSERFGSQYYIPLSVALSDFKDALE